MAFFNFFQKKAEKREKPEKSPGLAKPFKKGGEDAPEPEYMIPTLSPLPIQKDMEVIRKRQEQEAIMKQYGITRVAAGEY